MKYSLIGMAAAALVGSPAFAQAGPQSTASATASADIVSPLTISCTEMKFGKLAPLLTGASTVTISPQGTVGDPQNIVVPGIKELAQPSNCNVRGEHMLGYKVSLPTSGSISNGTATMALRDFSISSDDPLPANDRVLGDVDQFGGFDGFGVGATLDVAAGQAPGIYTGSFQVSVQYN